MFFNKQLSGFIIFLTIFFFFLSPVPFNGQDNEKQNKSGTDDQTLFRLQNKFREIPLLVTNYLTKFDDVI